MDASQNAAIIERISRIHLTWKRWLERRLIGTGLNLKQIALLHRLSEIEYLNPSQVADLLFSDRPTTTVLLATLERRGLLVRSRDPEQRKRVRVTITPAGRRALRDLPPISRGGDDAHDPLQPLSKDERVVLLGLLERVAARLAELPGETDDVT